MVAEFCHNLLLSVFVWFSKFQKEPRFKRWIVLEEQKNRILEAVEESKDSFPDELLGFLSTALYLPVRMFEKASWINLVKAFYLSLRLTQCQFTLPIFEPTKNKTNPDAWEYENRVWYAYVHLLASSYGWTVEYISNLKLQNALSAIQEILIDKQLEDEFQWTMSERSSYYDSHTKTAKANPLPRPHWMHKHIDPKKDARTTQVPTSMLPMGAGITQDELIAQTIKH